jgi:hypothetical protein
MNESFAFDELTRQITRWERRRFWSDASLWLPRGLLAGLIAAAAVAVLVRLRPVLLNRELAFVTLGLAALGLILSLAALLLRRRTLADQARYFDRRFRLQERTSTAVEIQAGRLATTPALTGQQLADAAWAGARVDVERELSIHPRRSDLVMIVITIALLFLAVLLPNSQAAILDEQQAVAESIADQVTALQAIEQQIQDDPLLSDLDRQELLQPVQGALRELNSDTLSRAEAVAVLSQAEADLRELSAANDQEASDRILQAAGRPLTNSPATQTLGQALVSGDLLQANSAANQLADNLAQITAAEAEAAAQDLSAAAAAIQAADPAMSAELAAAAQALQSGDLEAARQALRGAAVTMQQRALEQAAATQAQAAAGQLQSAREQVASAGVAGGSATSAEGLSTADGSDSDQAGAGQSQDGQGQQADSGSGQSSFSEDGQGAGGPGPGGGHAESVFVPEYVDLSAESGVEIELPAECIANPENCGALISERPTEFTDEHSLVPYDQVFGDYRQAAYEALEGDYVPLGLKGFVRDYFSSLEP